MRAFLVVTMLLTLPACASVTPKDLEGHWLHEPYITSLEASRSLLTAARAATPLTFTIARDADGQRMSVSTFHEASWHADARVQSTGLDSGVLVLGPYETPLAEASEFTRVAFEGERDRGGRVNRVRIAFDMEVRLGVDKKHRIPARLVARRLPQEVANRRRHKVKKHAQSNHRAVTKTYLALLDWDIFVTTVPDSMLSALQVTLLYRVRWQIELVFKLCKSYCGLRHTAHMRRDRLLTELYARLIGIVLTYFLVAPIRLPYTAHTNCEISPVQARTIFRRFARTLNQSLANLDQLEHNLADMLQHIQHFGFKQKRKRRPNVCHALHLASVVYGIDLNLNHQQELDLLTLLA